MAIKDVIAGIRKDAGQTQEQMARELYVTRQAISRWETGETEPGVDMIKLIAVTYGVPLEKFFDMPARYFCQCCGMPIEDAAIHGTERDGSASEDYCKWCYQGGEFTARDISMDDFIEATAKHYVREQGGTIDDAVSFMATMLPRLKRWADVQVNERMYGEEARGRYGDEVIDAANAKYLAISEIEHLDTEELGKKILAQLGVALATGDVAGPEARKLALMHKEWLCRYWPDGMYTPEAHKTLADGYLADERFKAYYEVSGEGAAEFLRDAIHACIG